MEESRRKRSESEDLTVIFTGKRPRTSEMSDEEQILYEEEEEDLLAIGYPIEEEMVMQVMKVLEDELRFPNNKIQSTSSSSSYFTINDNEESCGPSFSDLSSTVMASIDIGSINISYLLSFSEEFKFSSGINNNSMILPETTNPELILPNEVEINGGDDEEEEAEESVDEWISRVINGDLIEFEDDCLV